MNKQKIATWLTAITLSLSPVSAGSGAYSVQATEQVRIQDDLYQAVNREWLSKVKLDDYTPVYSNANEIQDELTQQLFSDLDNMIIGDLAVPNEALEQFVTFSHIAQNLEQREQQGAQPIRPYLDKIDAIQSLDELQQVFKEWAYLGVALPFSYSVIPDFKDSTKHIVALDEAPLISLDKSLYEDEAHYKEYLEVYRDSKIKLLTLMGYSQDVATKTVDDVIQSDKALEPYMIAKEEMSDLTKFYNIRSAEDVRQYTRYADLPAIAKALIGQDVSQYLVSNVAYFERLNEWFNPDQLEVIKSRMRLSMAQEHAAYLSEEIRVTNEVYANKVAGINASYDAPTAAYLLALETFNEPIGTYYGQTYFGEEARREVEEIAHQIIETYKERLKHNDWLEPKTIQGALRKLETLKVYIGYPDYEAIPYSKGVIQQDATLLETIVKMKYDEAPTFFERIEAPVPTGVWEMSADEVNAYYTPIENAIYFPAGYLQAPNYSKDQTLSEKYAGIGATIGHEITHAFDPSGSKFDEYGNLKDWWTPKDLKAYEEKSQAMIEQWNQLQYVGMNINGKLAITENVADAGGLRVALDALKKVAGNQANMEEFFTNWARTWREKGKDDYYRTLILTDEHPPSELRANIQVMYLDEFHDTYQTKEGDGMYLAPDKRLTIW